MSAQPTDVDRKGVVNRLKNRLESVIGKIRFYYFLHGMGVVLGTAFVFAVLSFLTDYLIPDLPAGMRIIILFIGVGIILYKLWTSLLRPQLVNLTARDIALAVEDSYPQLEDRLISALDLKDYLDREGNRARISRELVEELISDVDRTTQNLNLSGILSVKSPLKSFGLGMLCLLFAFGFWVQFPTASQIWLRRMTGHNDQWPKSTKLALETPNGLEVVSGKPVDLRARVLPDSREFPEKAYIYLNYDSGQEKEGEMNLLKKREDGSHVFGYRLSSVREEFTYSVAAGDNETKSARVRVLPRPRVEHLLIEYDYPEYTGKEDTPKGNPIKKRAISAPYDTVATVFAPVEVPIEKAKAFFKTPDDTKEMKSELLKGEEAAGFDADTVVKTKIPVRKDGSLYYHLFVKDPKKSKGHAPPGAHPYRAESIRFSVKTLIDSPPSVRITYPGRDKKATPKAVIPLRSSVKDDFGIKNIWLNVKTKGEEARKITYTSSQNDDAYESSEINSEYTLQFEDLGVKEGDVLKYTLNAKDMGEKNKPVSSREYRFSIVSEAKMEEFLSRLQEKIRDELKRVRDDQQNLNSQLVYNRRQIHPDRKLTDDLRLQLKQRLNSQRSIKQHMRRVVKLLRSLNRDAEYNNLWNREARRDLEKLYEMARNIWSDLMPKPEKEIARALNTTHLQKRNLYLSSAEQQQRTILQRLNELLSEMEHWADLSDVIHRLKAIKKSQEDLKDEFERRKRRNGNNK